MCTIHDALIPAGPLYVLLVCHLWHLLDSLHSIFWMRIYPKWFTWPPIKHTKTKLIIDLCLGHAWSTSTRHTTKCVQMFENLTQAVWLIIVVDEPDAGLYLLPALAQGCSSLDARLSTAWFSKKPNFPSPAAVCSSCGLRCRPQHLTWRAGFNPRIPEKWRWNSQYILRV